MKTEIENAMKTLAEKAGEAKTADEAMKYSQAVLNLSHARITNINADKV